MNITMIYGADDSGVIGNGQKLPAWDAPEDMKHFREYTKGKIVVMGRKTADTLKKALPKRLNIVLSNTKTGEENGFIYVPSEKMFDTIPEDRLSEEIIIMGGAEIYEMYEPIANKIMYSHIHGEFGKGDTDVMYNQAIPSDWESKKLDHSTDKVTFYELTRKDKYSRLYEDTPHGQILITIDDDGMTNEYQEYDEEMDQIVTKGDPALQLKVEFQANIGRLSTTQSWEDSDLGLMTRNAEFNMMTRDRAITMVDRFIEAMPEALRNML